MTPVGVRLLACLLKVSSRPPPPTTAHFTQVIVTIADRSSCACFGFRFFRKTVVTETWAFLSQVGRKKVISDVPSRRHYRRAGFRLCPRVRKVVSRTPVPRPWRHAAVSREISIFAREHNSVAKLASAINRPQSSFFLANHWPSLDATLSSTLPVAPDVLFASPSFRRSSLSCGGRTD